MHQLTAAHPRVDRIEARLAPALVRAGRVDTVRVHVARGMTRAAALVDVVAGGDAVALVARLARTQAHRAHVQALGVRVALGRLLGTKVHHADAAAATFGQHLVRTVEARALGVEPVQTMLVAAVLFRFDKENDGEKISKMSIKPHSLDANEHVTHLAHRVVTVCLVEQPLIDEALVHQQLFQLIQAFFCGCTMMMM